MENWKITENNIDKFQVLGNIIPTLSVFRQNFYPSLPTELRELIMNIYNNHDIEHTLVEDSFALEYMSKSNNKTISRLIDLCLMQYGIRLDNSGAYIMNSQGYNLLGTTICARFYNKWKKLYDTTLLEYDALSPYDMQIEEDGTDTMSSTSGIKQNNTNMNTLMKSRNLKDVNESQFNENTDSEVISDKTKDGYYGFNSLESNPSTESENTSKSNEKTDNTSTDTVERTGTENETNNMSENKNTDSTYERENPYTRNITRKGNIGNITKQELLKQERDILQYQILDVIFKDLDSVLTRSKYK